MNTFNAFRKHFARDFLYVVEDLYPSRMMSMQEYIPAEHPDVHVQCVGTYADAGYPGARTDPGGTRQRGSANCLICPHDMSEPCPTGRAAAAVALSNTRRLRRRSLGLPLQLHPRGQDDPTDCGGRRPPRADVTRRDPVAMALVCSVVSRGPI